MAGVATTILIDGTPTDGADPWVDSLVSGGAWSDGNGGTVTINWTAFQGTMEGENSYAWSPVALGALREALSLWESVANIDFVEVAGAADADVKIWWGTGTQAGEDTLGWSDLPGFDESEVLDVLFNAEDPSISGALGKGGMGLLVMVHELGHLLGLAHPHDGGAGSDATTFPGVTWTWPSYSYGTGLLNQGIYTTMSYNFGWPTYYSGHEAETYGYQYGPMALDIAAIQAIYGANTNHAAGNDVYMLPAVDQIGTYWSSIWDTGGIDTISNAGTSNNSTIDLREATAGINGGGYVSYGTGQYGAKIDGGYTIARGVVIENAIGGTGDDTITGNAAVNRLEGGSGNDILDGGAGADTMIGGSGYDIYYIDDVGDVIVDPDDWGSDTVYSSVSFTLGATLENLILTGAGAANGTGNSLGNTLTGNAGDNTLVSGGGADRIDGGAGNDRIVVGAFDFLSADGGDGVDTLVLLGAGDSLHVPETRWSTLIWGFEHFDITGAGDNSLYVSKAAVLFSGEQVGSKRVTIVERDQGDVVHFWDGGWTNVGAVTNTKGTFDRWVSGNAEVQVEQVPGAIVVGTAGNDSLNGGDGNDILYGQGGDDTLRGGMAAAGGTNQLWGGTGNDTASYVFLNDVIYADLGAQAGYVGGVLIDQMNSIENVIGGAGYDVLVGDAGGNVLSGGAGVDLLYGQGGDDTLIGGEPDYDGIANQLWGGTGNDTASYAWTGDAVYADLAAQAGYVDGYLHDQMNSIENLIGGSANDVLVGDAGGNVLSGGAGSDLLYGQGGDDVLIGGAAATGSTNQLWGGSGIDSASYVGTTGAVYADIRSLSAYVDGVLTDQMNSIENLTGGSGNNTLVGNGGGNVLTGGAKADYLYGMDGDDMLIGGGATPGTANQLWGGAGSDTASYAGTTGAVYADLGAQTGHVDGVLVDLMSSIENLTGGSNADTLVGNGGANRLEGGAGGDVLWGRGDADVFVYKAYADSNLVTGYDIIADFVSGTSKLDLTALGLDASHVVIQSSGQSTSLYIEKTAGTFDVSTDLAIALVGPNAVNMSDILF
jgi:serralysin